MNDLLTKIHDYLVNDNMFTHTEGEPRYVYSSTGAEFGYYLLGRTMVGINTILKGRKRGPTVEGFDDPYKTKIEWFVGLTEVTLTSERINNTDIRVEVNFNELKVETITKIDP